jgi:DNA-binding CsgD family transcriptional regulator
MSTHEYRKALQELREREKELACLYTLARVLTSIQPPETTARAVTASVRQAISDPATARVRLTVEGTTTDDPPRKPGESDREVHTLAEPPHRHESPIIAAEETVGSLSVTCRPPATLLGRERDLVDTAAALVANDYQRRRVEDQLRATAIAENRKTIALEEVLRQIETTRRHDGAVLRTALYAEVLPIVARLEDLHRGSTDQSLLRLLREALTRLGSDDTATRRHLRSSLTPREYEVAQLVASGMPTKQIADALRLAVTTVERHRHNIRRKLGINREKASLATLLRTGE